MLAPVAALRLKFLCREVKSMYKSFCKAMRATIRYYRDVLDSTGTLRIGVEGR